MPWHGGASASSLGSNIPPQTPILQQAESSTSAFASLQIHILLNKGLHKKNWLCQEEMVCFKELTQQVQEASSFPVREIRSKDLRKWKALSNSNQQT